MHIHFFQTISLRSPNVSALEKEFLGPYSTYPYQLQKESLPLYSLTMSQSDSPASSVESSPNITCRFLPCHLLKTLPSSKQVIFAVSDSEFESDEESVPPPAAYYVSPSKPEKRRHLSVPSPRMAQLSIEGQGRRFTPSIPGYGQGTKKTIRVSSVGFHRSGSTSSALSSVNLHILFWDEESKERYRYRRSDWRDIRSHA